MPILVEHFDLLWQAIENARNQYHLVLMAWVVLPDHIHMLIERDKEDVSDVMRRIKLTYSANYRKRAGLREGRVWQYRFWDHIIRDQEDLNRHLDYIHCNPVKHGATNNPFNWRYSSAARYLQEGYYAPDWGLRGVLQIDGEFGE